MTNSKNELSDEDLMLLYQSGDAAAFEALYRRHSGRVFDYLKKRTNSETACELLQDIFLKLHNIRHQYLAQYPFLPWLFAISRNALIDFLRLKETKIRENSETGIELSEFEPENSWTADLIHALQTLPVQQRRAIELRYRSDWTFEQIASELKISPLNVRQIISRGIRKLRTKRGSIG